MPKKNKTQPTVPTPPNPAAAIVVTPKAADVATTQGEELRKLAVDLATIWKIPKFFHGFFVYVYRQSKGVKEGWGLFVVLAVVLAVVVGGGVWWITAYIKDRKLAKSENDLTTAKTERDKYFLALQPWQALAASIYTNAPPDERVGLLLTNVIKLDTALRSMTNVLQALDPKKTPISVSGPLRNTGSLS